MSAEDETASPTIGDEGHANKDVESTAKKIPYPKSVFLILANEFCERFSYYGMRAILTLYLKNVLKFEEHTATTIYHAFTMLAYFTPLLGAMLADSFLGKFRTIFYLSIVYALGNIVLSLSSAHPLNIPAIPFTMVGLFLIAMGTGGIKPCVSSFGGDQFILPQQENHLASFFSIFYFSINAGSLISTFITPIFRKDVSCFGDDTCYTLAFSVPAALMITALVIFLIGKSMYIMRNPTGNLVISVVKTISHALKRKRKSKEKKEHWLDYAEDKYSKRDIADIKIVLRVLFLYIPLPFFWALFDQQGSTWTFQASRMKGDVGGYVFLPDQMQVVNPALVLILIPVFDRGIYPLLGKCGILKKPLQRLTLGGIFAGIAFVISGIVELQLQKTYPVELGSSESNLHFINMAETPVFATFNTPPNFADPFNISQGSNLNLGVLPSGQYELTFKDLANKEFPYKFNTTSKNATTILITSDPTTGLKFTQPQARVQELIPQESVADKLEKSSDGNPFAKIIHVGLWEDHLAHPEGALRNATLEKNLQRTVYLKGKKKNAEFEYSADTNVYPDWQSSASKEIDVHEYDIYIGANSTDSIGTIKVELGGSYIIAILKNDTVPGGFSVQLNTFVDPNSLHMFWLFPQYVIMTMGEIMFSITIMDFSYSEAPKSMKSVMQSAWLMTVAFGNLIVVIIAEARFFDKQWKEFFLFAGLMFLDMLIFSYMAYRYQPAQLGDDDDDAKDDVQAPAGKDNDAYEEDKDR